MVTRPRTDLGAPPLPSEAQLRSRLKMRQLALLAALTEERSLRKAAAVVSISQPAATKLLQELEEAVGVLLFLRHPWGVEPTLYGEAVVRYARRVLSDLSEVHEELGALHQGAAGVLRVGGVTGAVPRLLTPAIAAVRSAQPALRVFALVNASEMLWAALRQGTIDVAIATAPKPAEIGDFISEPLAREPLCIVARSGHPLSRRSTVLPAMLGKATWILQPPETPLRQSVDLLFTNHRLRLPGNLIETVSIVATLSLLQSEDALAVLPEALAQHYEAHGLLARLPVKLPPGSSPYELITLSNRTLSPPALAFMDAARTVAGPLTPLAIKRASSNHGQSGRRAK